MDDGYVFGYGSLVNRLTHEYPAAHPARVRGWRRAWRASPLRAVCYLTAVPDEDASLLGMIAPVTDWAALDERERAYARHDATGAVEHELDHAPQVTIYAIRADVHRAPGAENPVLMSYLDAVVQGFLAEFGEAGVAEFFQTTDGWDHAPILNDRARPVYGRHQRLDAQQTQMVDDWLFRVGARVRFA